MPGKSRRSPAVHILMFFLEPVSARTVRRSATAFRLFAYAVGALNPV